MASTVFVDGSTLTAAAWFNDVNTVAYTLFGNGSAYTGALTLGSSGNITVNTNKFTIAASSGNALIAGTLNVTGAAAFSSTLSASSFISTTSQVYPGLVAGGFQTSIGLSTASGVPSNASGNNNDWCISDNGHLYFRSGGAWSAKI